MVPDQQRAMARLEPLITQKLAELAATIDLHDKQSAEAALGVVSSDRGQALMDAIRREVAAMETLDGNGTFNITLSTVVVSLVGGMEGAFYVPVGSPLFPKPAVLIANYDNNNIITELV